LLIIRSEENSPEEFLLFLPQHLKATVENKHNRISSEILCVITSHTFQGQGLSFVYVLFYAFRTQTA